jgi:hypothetical protein
MDRPARSVSRRDALKRGAVLGGSLLWTAPIVQSITVPAFAQYPPDISYIALNITCPDGNFVVKWEVDEADWDPDPGSFPDCECFTPVGEKADGGDKGLTASSPDPSGCITINTGPCIATLTVVMGGGNCTTGPMGAGDLLFCPPAADTCN